MPSKTTGVARSRQDAMLPEYENLRSDFQEIKEQYARAKTLQEKLDLLKIAREILKRAQEQVAHFQDEIDAIEKSRLRNDTATAARSATGQAVSETDHDAA